MSNTKDIKRAQKESQLHRILSEIFLELVLEEPRLTGIYINKVVLSKDKSCCTILFFCADQQQFRDSFETLILYKPSMRKAIAQKMASRYVPELRFAFDKKCGRQQKLEAALHQVSKELHGDDYSSEESD